MIGVNLYRIIRIFILEVEVEFGSALIINLKLELELFFIDPKPAVQE